MGVTTSGVIDLGQPHHRPVGRDRPVLCAELGLRLCAGGRRLLVSHKGEGVFGLTYSARGAFSAPRIRVNPFSLATPGILRRLFRRPFRGGADVGSRCPRRRLDQHDQHDLFASGRKLDRTILQVRQGDEAVGVGDGLVVQTQAPALGQAAASEREEARPASAARVARATPASSTALDTSKVGRSSERRHARRPLPPPPAPPRPPRRRATGSWPRRPAPLGVVDLGSLKGFKPRHLAHRQIGEQPQEFADIGVLGVPPELPIVVRRQAGRRSATPRRRRSCPSWRQTRWVISGVVRPKAALASIRRFSSTPLTMLPH